MLDKKFKISVGAIIAAMQSFTISPPVFEFVTPKPG
jgi:hypothetical protein